MEQHSFPVRDFTRPRHRMEKLITNMLVSKNNRVRLEAARRTIEELEGAGKGD